MTAANRVAWLVAALVAGGALGAAPSATHHWAWVSGGDETAQIVLVESRSATPGEDRAALYVVSPGGNRLKMVEGYDPDLPGSFVEMADQGSGWEARLELVLVGAGVRGSMDAASFDATFDRMLAAHGPEDGLETRFSTSDGLEWRVLQRFSDARPTAENSIDLAIRAADDVDPSLPASTLEAIGFLRSQSTRARLAGHAPLFDGAVEALEALATHATTTSLPAPADEEWTEVELAARGGDAPPESVAAELIAGFSSSESEVAAEREP